MSLITKNNYEAFLLDYVEGNLSPEHTAELMLFFENNPSLKEEMDEFDLFTLDAETIDLKTKEELKIEEDKVTALTFDDFAIAEIEAVNSPEQSKAFKLYLKVNPNQQKEFAAYQKTKLVAGQFIFEDKAALKQKQGKVIPLYWWYSSAAAIILALFLLKGINWNEENTNSIIADEIENNETIKDDEKEQRILEFENNNNENLVAVEEDNKVEEAPEKNKVIKKQEPKEKPSPQVIEEKPKDVILANQPKEKPVHKDSTVKELPVLNEQLPVDDEYLVADNVKIVYEDEEEPIDNSVKSDTKKPTKMDAVRAVIKQQVKEGFLDKVKDESAMAFNDGPLSFLKRKNK